MWLKGLRRSRMPYLPTISLLLSFQFQVFQRKYIWKIKLRPISQQIWKNLSFSLSLKKVFLYVIAKLILPIAIILKKMPF